jgi:nitrite reductase/ring-hydroxylating ferredoxin subunit
MSSPTDAPFDTGITAAELAGGRPRPIQTPWGVVALYPTADGPVAANAFCPHMQGPLWEGTLAGDQLTCPWHGWRYSLRTGACTHVSRDEWKEGELTRYPLSTSARGTYLIHPPTGS